MANKYTRMIDEIFKKWDPTGTTKYIYLGYCHQGDEDGGCDEYDYICDDYWEIENQYPYKMEDEICFFYVPEDRPKLTDEEAEKERDEYRKDYSNLCHELLKSFGKALEADYSSTNCYWHRHYFITRDYKIISDVCRSDGVEGGGRVEANIDALNEADAENAADRQILEKIEDRCDSLKSLLKKIQYPNNKAKALAEIQKVLTEAGNSNYLHAGN